MNKEFDIHPALIISCLLLLATTIGTAIAMEKFPFSTALDTTKLDVKDLHLLRSSKHPRSEFK